MADDDATPREGSPEPGDGTPQRPERPNVEVSPLHRPDRGLAGFLLTGRWPESTREWVQFLTLAVRLAAVPGMLPTTSVYRSADEHGDGSSSRPTGIPHVVGVVELAGRVIADDPADIAAPLPGLPAALVLLHPPDETATRTPEADRPASGCVLLPGVPHLGLDHRAAWVEAEVDGTVTRLVSARGIDPAQDPDTAVLSLLLAA
ncbi:MAG: peptidase [Kineosporiaceae bacterium]